MPNLQINIYIYIFKIYIYIYVERERDRAAGPNDLIYHMIPRQHQECRGMTLAIIDVGSLVLAVATTWGISY